MINVNVDVIFLHVKGSEETPVCFSCAVKLASRGKEVKAVATNEYTERCFICNDEKVVSQVNEHLLCRHHNELYTYNTEVFEKAYERAKERRRIKSEN